MWWRSAPCRTTTPCSVSISTLIPPPGTAAASPRLRQRKEPTDDHYQHVNHARQITTTITPIPEGLETKIAYLTRVLKTPTIGRVREDLAATAREANWSHEEYLTAVLERQLADRESAGNTMRIRTAHFPQVKTLEDFNLEHLPSLPKDVLAYLATATFVPKAQNVILLGPPGIGKTHLAVGLGIKAAQAGYSVLFGVTVIFSARRAQRDAWPPAFRADTECAAARGLTCSPEATPACPQADPPSYHDHTAALPRIDRQPSIGSNQRVATFC
jgi:hypothetical protein